MTPPTDTSRYIGQRPTARIVADNGRVYCAFHYCMSEYAICARSPGASETGLTYLGSIIRWAGGDHDWGCYWQAIGGMEGGPFRGVRSALAGFLVWLGRTGEAVQA